MNEQSQDFEAALRKFRIELERERSEERLAKTQKELDHMSQHSAYAGFALAGFMLGIGFATIIASCADTQHRISALESKVSK